MKDNATMITEQLANLNDERRRTAESAVKNHIQNILAYKAQLATYIKDMSAKIAAEQEKLAAVTYTPATLADLT